MDGLLALDFWDVVIEVLCFKNSTKTPTPHLETDVTQGTVRGTHPNSNKKRIEMLINCCMWATSSQMHIPLSCTLLRTTKQ